MILGNILCDLDPRSKIKKRVSTAALRVLGFAMWWLFIIVFLNIADMA